MGALERALEVIMTAADSLVDWLTTNEKRHNPAWLYNV